MSTSTLGAALRQVHRLIDEGSPASLGDPRLLARYALDGDGPSFAALVERHGPMVLATCRAGLSDLGDVDDAFQATFLTLARRAGSVRDAEALGPWLHRVARRVVARSNRSAADRRRHERQAGEARPSAAGDREEIASALHEEIDRLPDRYRLPVVLCHLEGLTHAEAARRLRRGERTLRRHLAEALPKLRDRLVGRGVALGVPALLALLDRPASASVPESLLTRACRLAAPAAGPAAVATLAGRALLGSGPIPVKAASALAAGLIASACLARSVLALPGAGDPPMKPSPAPPIAAGPAAPPDRKAEGSWTFAGRVVDPDGRPVAGARLHLDSSIDPKELRPPLRATSGPDGRFRFAIDKAASGLDLDGSLFDLVHVVALADGFGLGVSDRTESDADRDLTVRLSRDDTPIVGRLIDLEGRPVVGATARVETFWAPDSGDLSPWIAAVKVDPANKGRYNSPANGLARADFPPGVDLIPPATSGADGRFRLAGVGRERLVELAIAGPSARKTKVTAMTRLGGTFLSPEVPGPDHYTQETYHGATFEIIVPPSRPVEGVVRDAETGRPVVGAVLYDVELADRKNYLNTQLTRATTGPDGRYRLAGLPKGPGNVVVIAPPEDQPYLPSWKAIDDAPGLGPVTVDLTLKRGAWATGRIFDEATGKPLRASSVTYFAARENPRLGEAPGFRDMKNFGLQGVHGQTTEDGRYRVAVLPGRGLLSVSVNDGRHPMLDPDPALTNALAPLYSGYDHARRSVDVPESGDLPPVDFAIDGGRTLSGTVLGPDGEPLPGARIYGTAWLGQWGTPARSAEFQLDGLKPPRDDAPEAEKALALVFRHDERRLAGWHDVRWDEPGPLRARLEPWAEAVGRVVDEAGKPRPGVAVRAFAGGGRKRRGGGLIPSQPGPAVVTDADGRFRLEGLAPGLPYQFQVDYEVGARWLDIPAAKAGEAADLGVVKTQGNID